MKKTIHLYFLTIMATVLVFIILSVSFVYNKAIDSTMAERYTIESNFGRYYAQGGICYYKNSIEFTTLNNETIILSQPYVIHQEESAK